LQGLLDSRIGASKRPRRPIDAKPPVHGPFPSRGGMQPIGRLPQIQISLCPCNNPMSLVQTLNVLNREGGCRMEPAG
jgi:hypothetical protein